MSGTAAPGRGEIFVNPALQPKRVARTIVLNQIQGQRRRTGGPSHMSLPGSADPWQIYRLPLGQARAPLLGDQEILREGPIVIDPLGLAVETCLGGDLE